MWYYSLWVTTLINDSRVFFNPLSCGSLTFSLEFSLLIIIIISTHTYGMSQLYVSSIQIVNTLTWKKSWRQLKFVLLQGICIFKHSKGVKMS